MDGYVLKLLCSRCKHTFPHAVFSGDTDMATDGLCSLSAPVRNEVVIGELNASEYKLGFDDGTQMFKGRISKSLGREDLQLVRLIRVEPEKIPPRGGFQMFRAKYKPPRIIYSCAACAVGESSSIEKMDWNQFQKAGGQITMVGSLELMG